MLQVPRFPWFVALSTVCSLVCLTSSSADARQWPAHGGPVIQAVPQYRGGYPLQQQMQATTPTQPLQYKPEAQASEPVAQPLPLPIIQPAAQPMVQRENVMEPVEVERRPTTPRRKTAAPTPPGHPATPQATVRYPLNPAVVPAVPPTPKKKSTPPADARTNVKADAKQGTPSEPVVRYDIYRDRNLLPIDPRKPFSPCTQPSQHSGCCGCGGRVYQGCEAPGLYGKPYQEVEPGGCACGKKKCGMNKPLFNQYWPRPFSAKLDEHFAQRASDRYRCPGKKSCLDAFDRFVDFKLVDYHRKDNGYCGEDSDSYGCLGESRMIASGAVGVGYRFPSVPIERSAAKESSWY